jgi:WD40 repeat protein
MPCCWRCCFCSPPSWSASDASQIKGVALSPDHTLLATTHVDGRVRLWDTGAVSAPGADAHPAGHGHQCSGDPALARPVLLRVGGRAWAKRGRRQPMRCSAKRLTRHRNAKRKSVLPLCDLDSADTIVTDSAAPADLVEVLRACALLFNPQSAIANSFRGFLFDDVSHVVESCKIIVLRPQGCFVSAGGGQDD